MCSQQTKDSRILLGRKRWVFERDKRSTNVRRVTTCNNYCNMWGAVEQSINSGCHLRFVRWKKRWQRDVEAEAGRRVPRVPRDATCPCIADIAASDSIWKWNFVPFATTLFISVSRIYKDSVGTMGTIKVYCKDLKQVHECCLMLSHVVSCCL